MTTARPLCWRCAIGKRMMNQPMCEQAKQCNKHTLRPCPNGLNDGELARFALGPKKCEMSNWSGRANTFGSLCMPASGTVACKNRLCCKTPELPTKREHVAGSVSTMLFSQIAKARPLQLLNFVTAAGSSSRASCKGLMLGQQMEGKRIALVLLTLDCF